jgi:ferrochelatase
VDYPRWLWWILLKIILAIRPAKSAKAYRKIWTGQGSPLLVYSKRQLQALQSEVEKRTNYPLVCALGMRYGNPSIESALNTLRSANARRILVLPLYPQYSSSTTASTFDAIAAVVKSWRWVPEFRFVNQYHDHPQYIDALANSINEVWEKVAKPEKLLFSFHGTPKRYLTTGDPYHCQCQVTARLVAEKLQLQKHEWDLTFQSIFGREEWLQPYTIKTLEQLGKAGVSRVHVVCPGFSADCLETIEEIDQENRHAFLASGGKEYQYIPALNDRDDHIDALFSLIQQHCQGWIDFKVPWSSNEQQTIGVSRSERAKALGAER